MTKLTKTLLMIWVVAATLIAQNGPLQRKLENNNAWNYYAPDGRLRYTVDCGSPTEFDDKCVAYLRVPNVGPFVYKFVNRKKADEYVKKVWDNGRINRKVPEPRDIAFLQLPTDKGCEDRNECGGNDTGPDKKKKQTKKKQQNEA